MAGLQVLEEEFGERGFHVLGFYSDDFGKQGGSDEQIQKVTQKYGVTFPQFVVAPVSGDAPRPVFEWLFAQDNPGPKKDLPPSWNFHKWLVSRTGQLVGAFDIKSYPGDGRAAEGWADSEIVQAIERELAKST